MTTLQTATDYSVLVYCSLMVLTLISVLIVGLVVKSKINKVRQNIKQKVDLLTNLPYIGKHVVEAIKKNLK